MNNLYIDNKEFEIKKLMEESDQLLESDNVDDIRVFRLLLEGAMKIGFWNGFVGNT